MSNTVKEPNYTDEMVERLFTAYSANPTRECVDELAEELGKKPRSVISKLCTMGIYVTPPKATKSGAPVVKKVTLVEQICEKLDIEAASLIKANKRDLEKIVNAL